MIKTLRVTAQLFSCAALSGCPEGHYVAGAEDELWDVATVY